jgi:hypothetical protein
MTQEEARKIIDALVNSYTENSKKKTLRQSIASLLSLSRFEI